MEPLQGWGLPPWILAPKTGALRLALLCLFLGALLGQGSPPCREEEFPVGAMCCPRCSPGQRVKEACEETRRTVCAPCSPGTYTVHLNGLFQCLPCHLCDRDRGLVTRRKCSSTGNTVCGCDQGHFCVLVDGDDCAECWPHSDCRPGQRVQETGTEWQDTVCEDCPPGTFSAGGIQAVCEPWTKCSGLLEMEVKSGTNSTDVTCSSLRGILFLGVFSILCVFTYIIVRYIIKEKTCEETTQRTPVSVDDKETEQKPLMSAVCMSLGSCQTSPRGRGGDSVRVPESDPQLMNASGCRHLSISMGPADCSRPPRTECGAWGAAGTHPEWLSLHQTQEGTSHCSGGLEVRRVSSSNSCGALSSPLTPC